MTLISHSDAFEIYYALGATRTLPKLLEAVHGQSTDDAPAADTLKKWSARYKWQNKIVIRDNATYEGVAEKMTEAAVDVKMIEIARVDKAQAEIAAIKPLIPDALTATLYTDEKTGKKRCSIVPENTQDMAALYRAHTAFINAEIKLIEIKIKLLGIPDTHVVTLERRVLSDDPDIMAAKNEVLKLMAEKEAHV